MTGHLREFWWRLRTHWNGSDTAVLVPNLCAFVLLVVNCWNHSIAIAYVAAGVPLVIQGMRARYDRACLGRAVVFGGLTVLLWSGAEWLSTRVIGWWGQYDTKGIMILDTPLYCLLIAWQSNTYLCHFERRAREWGYGWRVASCFAGFSALSLGVLGENLYVAAGMWSYHPSAVDWLAAPAFIPVTYGLVGLTLPFLARWRVWVAAVVYVALTVFISVALGLAIGFYPR